MMGPSLIPAAGGGGGVASGTPVRERVVFYEELTSSGTWTKATVLARQAFDGLTDADIVMRVRCVGGGAGGRIGATEYGGMPGSVVTRTFRMSDLGATEDVVVGLGGASAASGGATLFGSTISNEAKVRAFGGATAVASAVAELYAFMVLASESHVANPAVINASSFTRPSSGNGPGGGGPNGGSRLIDGGFGSARNGALSTTGGQTEGAAGSPAVAGKFDSFGAGGASNSSGVGGAGAFPGGGGGAGSSTGGAGGNGCLRIEYLVMEVA